MSFIEVNRIIEDRVSIVEVVKRYVKLQSSGRRLVGLCPFHKEKTPSFSVNEEKQFYHCFGCGAHGNALTFVMNIEHLSFPEAVRKLGNEFGIRELLQERNDPSNDQAEQDHRQITAANRAAALFFHHKLNETPAALAYLHERGISLETIRRFGIGWIGNGDELLTHLRAAAVSPKILEKSGLARLDGSGRLRSFFHDRIMIPVINLRRQVIGFGGRIIGPGEPKYLNTAETPVFLKRASLFGANLIRDGLRDHRYIILTEGYFDVMALHAHGFTTAVAALGTAIGTEHLKLLERFGVPVVMLLDGDAAGRKAMRRVLELELPEKLDLRAAFIESPDGKEDPDSLVRGPNGPSRIEQLVSRAEGITQHYLSDLAEQALRDPNLPQRDLAKEEMARLVLRYPAYRRGDHLNYIEELPRRIRTVSPDDAKKLRKETEAQMRELLKREKGRPGATRQSSPEMSTDRSAARLKPISAHAVFQDLLLLAATHPTLIPALDDPVLDRYDRADIRRALLDAYDAGEGDAVYHRIIGKVTEDERAPGAPAPLEADAAEMRFRSLLSQIHIAAIDETLRDLAGTSHPTPEEIAEIQRLRTEKKQWSDALIGVRSSTDVRRTHA
ncbi:MAG TPA: DNA primase [bacterium]|nr:DNA primase [bacterium]